MNVDSFFFFSKKNHQVLLFTRARLPRKTCSCIAIDLGSKGGAGESTHRRQVDEEPLCGCATTTSLFMRQWVYKYIYIISYKLAALATLSLKSRDQWYFFLSCIAYQGKLSVCLVPVHFLHVSIIVSYHLSGQKLLCRKARNTLNPLKEKGKISK